MLGLLRASFPAVLAVTALATGVLAGGCNGGGGSGATPTATATVPSPTPTAPASTPTPSPTTMATATATNTPPLPTPTPCPTYTLVPSVGGMAANVTDASMRWNAWLGCTVFSVGGSGIPVGFAPAEIQDIGWGQYTGSIYLMPPTKPPADDPNNGYAGDYERLTCVIMHALGHVLGYADGSPTAPKIMRPLDWPTWPPTSCSTPDSP